MASRDTRLRADGELSRVQHRILARLDESCGRMLRMAELADLLRSSRSRVTYQVTKLERDGLVRRTADPHDERGVLVALTDQGRRALETATRVQLHLLRRQVEGALTPTRLEQLACLMDKLREHFPRIC
ncbi:MarR family winged helix-turn-helix transcriptional regulator [Actinomadura adrarensis]|uniref:MarR family winged helix-turn-helix transcriptional regulator n=1 Tax=Actinomadura adrarensis TaxID=1819600 RepID=A0ABW3CR78_9ACTN